MCVCVIGCSCFLFVVFVQYNKITTNLEKKSVCAEFILKCKTRLKSYMIGYLPNTSLAADIFTTSIIISFTKVLLGVYKMM